MYHITINTDVSNTDPKERATERFNFQRLDTVLDFKWHV